MSILDVFWVGPGDGAHICYIACFVKISSGAEIDRKICFLLLVSGAVGNRS